MTYYHNVDHTKPPFIDISLPPAIILPAISLITLYGIVLGLDFYLLRNDCHFNSFITPKELRICMALVHIIIPMIFISNHPPCNVLFAAAPWFLASYSAHMPTDQLTIEKWIYTIFKITIDNNESLPNKTKIRCKGISKLSLGIFKLVFMKIFINPLLPRHSEYALEYAWFNPMSLIYTVLFGIKAYCLLGAVDVFMGIEQTLFAWNMIYLFNSPIISSSPRDFWSRRWNRVVRNLLHTQVFTSKTNGNDSDKIISFSTKPKSVVVVQKPLKKRSTRKTKTLTTATTTVTKRGTQSSAAVSTTDATAISEIDSPITTDDDENIQTTPSEEEEPITNTDHDVKEVTQHHITYKKKSRSFWSTKQGRGLLSFIISGVFHELIIMSACRKITLENLFFFTLQGVSVIIEVELRQGALKQEPQGKTRILFVTLQLLFMSITGRLFTAPFLRYNFFTVD